MNVAVLYSGHLRTWNACRQNQVDSFYTDNTESYFYTYDEPNTPYRQFVKIPCTYYDKKLDIYDSNKNPITQADTSLQQWHVNFVGSCLVPNNYDIYVKSRADIVLSGSINFNDYEIDDKNIYIPWGNDHCGGVNDQFAFGSYEVMKKYFSVYLEHGNLFARGFVFHTEHYVTENLRDKGVNIVRLPQTSYIVR